MTISILYIITHQEKHGPAAGRHGLKAEGRRPRDPQTRNDSGQPGGHPIGEPSEAARSPRGKRAQLPT